MNLIDRFQAVVEDCPAAPALIHRGQVASRSQLLHLVSVVARQLHERGVVPGEVIGLSMGHSPLHLAAILALARLGAISLPVHNESAPAAQLRLMEQFGAGKLVRGAGGKTLDGVEVIELGEIVLPEDEKADLRFIDYWPEPATSARIGLTSGTTGAPNGILYTHEYWLHRIATTIDNCDAQTRLMPSNLHLTLGNLGAFAALFAGGVVVFQKLHDLRAFYTTINLYAVTHALTSPASISDLASINREQGIAFPSLRHLRIVGGGITESQFALARTHLTPNVYLPYGLSEVGAVSIATPELLAAHPHCAGRIKDGVRVEALGEDGKCLPPGMPGELRVSIPGMPTAYYRNAERTAERFKDGWFLTRDIGRVTTDGLIEIEGRVDDRINLGGQKLHPERIENVLQQHPEVREAAVFPVENRVGNPVLLAAVVLNHAGKIEKPLTEFCRERKLGGIAPRRFLLVKELPRNPAGKLMRSALPELLRRAEKLPQ